MAASPDQSKKPKQNDPYGWNCFGLPAGNLATRELAYQELPKTARFVQPHGTSMSAAYSQYAKVGEAETEELLADVALRRAADAPDPVTSYLWNCWTPSCDDIYGAFHRAAHWSQQITQFLFLVPFMVGQIPIGVPMELVLGLLQLALDQAGCGNGAMIVSRACRGVKRRGGLNFGTDLWQVEVAGICCADHMLRVEQLLNAAIVFDCKKNQSFVALTDSVRNGLSRCASDRKEHGAQGRISRDLRIFVLTVERQIKPERNSHPLHAHRPQWLHQLRGGGTNTGAIDDSI